MGKWGTLLLPMLLAWLGTAGLAPAQEQAAGPTLEQLQAKLEDQAGQIRALRERLEHHESIFSPSSDSKDSLCDDQPSIRRLPVVVEEKEKPACDEDASGGGDDFHTIRFYADYDQGFVTRPFDPEEHPFEMRWNGWIQFRHHAFARDVDSWTDNAGVTRPVRNRNAFDIERARLTLEGFALDQRLTYFLQLDGDTDGSHTVDFFDYWWAWRFNDRLQVQLGKRKVPASRQWLLGARRTRFVDRPMTNDFFRPDRTVGLFAVGRIGRSGHYEAMVGNGYRTSNLPESLTDNQFSYAVTNYWDPLGDYGGQLVDYSFSSTPLLRFGHSFVYSPQSADEFGEPLEEANFLRLSDGTRLTQAGALAPGVTVSEFDIFFYGVDFAAKWRGFSVNSELFLRWIEQIEGDGPLPLDSIFQHGFYVEGGWFLVPRKLDANVRYSQVDGRFGNASEYAAGINWYPLDSAYLKLSFDVTWLDGSPLQNTTSDILVGDDGTLFRTQFQAEF